MSENEPSAVQRAFRRARTAVAEHTDAMAASDGGWREETLTELVLKNALPEVRFADFTHREEKGVGADWLWWWVDPDGTCFGALVQAKNLTFSAAGTPRIRFRHAGGRQLEDLLVASDVLEVPALYSVYFGGLESRHWLALRWRPPCSLRALPPAGGSDGSGAHIVRA